MEHNPSKRYTEKNVKDIVSHAIGLGCVTFSLHAKQRMKERGYSIQDVFYILENGSMVSAQMDDKTQTWRYTFQGEDLENESGSVVVTIETFGGLIVITVLSS